MGAPTVKFNLLQKGERKTIYDRKGMKRSGIYQDLDDHMTLNSHSYALFQKEQFALRKKERKRNLVIKLIVVVITFLLIMLFLYLWKSSDGSVLVSPHFQ